MMCLKLNDTVLLDMLHNEAWHCMTGYRPQTDSGRSTVKLVCIPLIPTLHALPSWLGHSETINSFITHKLRHNIVVLCTTIGHSVFQTVPTHPQAHACMPVDYFKGWVGGFTGLHVFSDDH